VQLCYDPAALRVVITDTGRGQASPIATGMTGHGLIGMRERATSVGGTLEAGPGREGGFRVAAVLPAVDGESG
jgi:signal transduction histidine kinase